MMRSLLDRAWRLGLWVAYRLLRLYWRALRPHTHGVYVAVWSGGRLLLVRHSYKPGASLPAGGCRRGEAPERAAARELREEVGIAVRPDELRAAGEMVSRELGKHDHLRFFEIELAEEPAVVVDGREVVRGAWCSRSEALALDLVAPVRAWLEGRRQGIDSTV